MKKSFNLLSACLALCMMGTAWAQAPVQTTQVPGYYKMNLGDVQVTALFDGVVQIDTKVLKNVTPQKIQAAMKRLYVSGPAVQTAVNAYLVHTGKKLILIDSGVGAEKMFGPALGKIKDSLQAAGYTAENVDMVLLTHLHADHMNGIVTEDGKMAFPNAEIWSSQADNDFWLNEQVAAKAPEGAQGLFALSKRGAAPYQVAGRWKIFAKDQELVPGIRSIAAVGHTPGHSAYMIESQGQKLLIWGDLVHNHAVQFAHPETSIEFDTDPKQAVVTRKKYLDKVISEELLVAGMHMPFPGIGHVRKEAKGYRWIPVEFSPLSSAQ